MARGGLDVRGFMRPASQDRPADRPILIDTACKNLGMPLALNVDQTELSVIYGGEAVKEHQIEVEVLAPALLGLANAVKEANRIADPDRRDVSVMINASRPGSFAVDLALQVPLTQGLFDGVVSLLNGNGVTATLNLRDLVALVFAAVLGARKIKGRIVHRRTRNVDGTITLTLSDGETLTLEEPVVRLLANRQFMSYLRMAFAPATKKGIDTVTISAADGTTSTVNSSEAALIGPVDQAPVQLTETTREVVVQPKTAVFEGDYVWRFTTDGSDSFTAKIEDPDFTSRLNDGTIRMGRHDELKVELHEVQERDPKGDLRMTRTIPKVMEFRPSTQPSLFDVESDDPDHPEEDPE